MRLLFFLLAPLVCAQSIVELAVGTPVLSTLLSVLMQPAYRPVLQVLTGDGPFTVFAPTDAAFKAAGVDISNVAALTEVLKHHVVSGKIPSSALAPSQSVKTLQGSEVTVQKTWRGVFVGEAKVVVGDVMASNGVVHVIDKVLALPPSVVELVAASPKLKTLLSVLTLPDYKPVLQALQGDGPFTVFAPTDAAFKAAGVDVTNVAAVTEVLKHHVVSGKVPSSALEPSQSVQTLQGSEVTIKKTWRGVLVGKAKVVAGDKMARNGVVHVINKLLMPPAAPPSIVELAVATPVLSTLLSVLTNPDYKPVLQALEGDGPFTVFAPNNAAFKAAGVDVNDVAAVTEVLKYHVVSGKVESSALKGIQSATTLQGSEVTLDMGWKGVMVNQAKVMVGDVMASNGVVHVINKVLIPPPSIVALAVATPTLSTLETVLTLPEYKPVLQALQGSGPFTVFAPTDAAFKAAGVDISNVAAVTEVLKYHVVSGKVPSSALKGSQSVKTLQGNPVSIKTTWEGVMVNQAKVVVGDVMASNGVVHVINGVLRPAMAARFGETDKPTDSPTDDKPTDSPTDDKPTDSPTDDKPTDTPTFGPAMNANQVVSRIATAIRVGVPLYNAGDIEGCRDVYLEAAQEIANSGGFGSKKLAVAVATARTETATQGAWTLRYAFDALLAEAQEEETQRSLTTVAAMPKMNVGQVIDTIAEAIRVGGPLYNEGDYQGCFDTYLEAAKKVASSESFGYQKLTAAIATATTETAQAGAWTLRYAFDAVIAEAQTAPADSTSVAADTNGFALDVTTLRWEVVNDSVMGGVSTSTVRVDSLAKSIVFSGYATTASNGGFATCRSYSSVPTNFDKCRGLKIDVKGDGLKYGFEVRNGNNNFRTPTWEVPFVPTSSWTTIEIPFASLVATFMGQGDFNSKMVSKNIYSFGLKRSAFTGGYKDSTFKSGNFNVQLRSISCLV